MAFEPALHSEPLGAAVTGGGVVLGFGRRVALAESDFEVPLAALTSVIGPNGSGKSTLLHAVAGLIHPRQGTLDVLGRTPEAAHELVAYVFQATRVNDVLPVTVQEVVAMGRYGHLGLFARPTSADRLAVVAALDRLGIEDLAGRHLRELSAGERQRVFVAQGLVQDAELLLLDEPVTALDAVSHRIIDEVIEQEVERGTTVVLTTHDLDEARRSDHVLLLGGRVVAQGPPEEVLTDARLAAAYGAHLIHAEAGVTLDDPHHAHGPEPGPGAVRPGGGPADSH